MFKVLALVLSLFLFCGSAFAKGSSHYKAPELPSSLNQASICLIEINSALVNGNLFVKAYDYKDGLDREFLIIKFGNTESYVPFSGSDINGQRKKYKQDFINLLRTYCGAK